MEPVYDTDSKPKSKEKTVSNVQCVAFLNELLALDKKAIEELFAFRVSCNQDLANHPTVQVIKIEGKHTVSILGILNGLFGGMEKYPYWGTIAETCDKETRTIIDSFSIITEEMVDSWQKK